jgi:hypothetical protein
MPRFGSWRPLHIAPVDAGPLAANQPLRAIVEHRLKVEPGLPNVDIGGIERGLRHERETAIFQAVGMIGEGRAASGSRVDHLVDGLARHIDDEGMIGAAHGVPGRLRHGLAGRHCQGQRGEGASAKCHCGAPNFSRASASL